MKTKQTKATAIVTPAKAALAPTAAGLEWDMARRESANLVEGGVVIINTTQTYSLEQFGD